MMPSIFFNDRSKKCMSMLGFENFKKSNLKFLNHAFRRSVIKKMEDIIEDLRDIVNGIVLIWNGVGKIRKGVKEMTRTDFANADLKNSNIQPTVRYFIWLWKSCWLL